MDPQDIATKLKISHRLKSDFERKLKEVQHLSKSIQDALKLEQATWLDHKTLEEEFQKLIDRWNDYESNVNDLKKGFEQADNNVNVNVNDELENIDKALDESSDAYIKLKLDVASLLRGVQNFVYGNLDLGSNSSQGSSWEESGSELEDGQNQSKIVIEDPAPENEGCNRRKFGTRVLIGMVAILLVYFVFFLVISHFVNSRAKEGKADAQYINRIALVHVFSGSWIHPGGGSCQMSS